MQKVLLTFLFGLLIMPNLNAQNRYENDLKEEYVLKLSFNLIDRFYESGNVTLFLKSWLEVRSNEEFEQVFPNFTLVQNKSVRVKVFNGIVETIGKDKDFLYGNLLGITKNPITADYWADYLLKHYPFSEQKNNAEQENYSIEPIANENELYQEETTEPLLEIEEVEPANAPILKIEEPTNNNGDMALPTSQTIYIEDKENDCKKTFGTICLKVFENQIAYSSFGSTSNDYCLIKLAISIVENKDLEESVNKVFVKFTE